MGKVREETSAKVSKPEASKPAPAKSGRGRLAGFFLNFLRADRYKPTQGKHARLWTAIGLAIVLGAGLITLHNRFLIEMETLPRVLWPVGLGVLAAWVIWRIVEYPPFVDFLIATEAEMLKVSWTSRAELQRATLVVLTTVLVLSIFLAGVDVVWSQLLKLIGVLRFEGEGLGSSEG